MRERERERESAFSIWASSQTVDSDDATTQQDLICPISLNIIRDPVKCSDGHTYDRKFMEKWAQENETSPKIKNFLKFDQQGDVKKVWCLPNTEMQKKITEFKKKKAEEQDISKQSVEGEEERHIFLSRLGHERKD